MKYVILLAICLAAVQANVNWSKVRHVRREMPVNPRHTWSEWQQIFAKQVPKGQKIVYPNVVSPSATGHKGRIINGRPASRGQFPYQAAIVMDQSSFCGGSLISPMWILTAGHCTSSHYYFTVTLGATSLYNPTNEAVTVNTQSKITHPQFDPMTLNFDLALLYLQTQVPITAYIQTIQLPGQYVGDLVGSVARLSGWGAVQGGGSVTPDMNYVDLPIIDNSVCASYFGDSMNADKICTSGENGSSPCNGDSGGPLVIWTNDERWVEVGIVSFGSQGCPYQYPAVFTRVTSYVDWIASQTGIVLASKL